MRVKGESKGADKPQSSYHNFQKKNWRGDHFEFFAKHKNASILKTVLDRANCTDFGCHNSIRLEAEHFLNTLALTFVSFLGRFVFAVQKNIIFFLQAIL